eukprot:SM000002S05770  [mRNA]  locus=s2:2210633:2212693:+ [translate_table: standard]
MLASFSFEVHGKVQNVLFRKAAVEKARTMGLVGFCENTGHGTVRGEVQGGARALEEMYVAAAQRALVSVWSPPSRPGIERQAALAPQRTRSRWQWLVMDATQAAPLSDCSDALRVGLAVALRKNWLANVGSPKSRIDRCVITDEVVGLAKPAYQTFEVIRRNHQRRLQSNPNSPSISGTPIVATTVDIREGQIIQHILLRRELSEACGSKISNTIGNWADMQPLCCLPGLHDVMLPTADEEPLTNLPSM